MEERIHVTPAEWQVMELLWQQPCTLMELVRSLKEQAGWAKSTVTTMVRRMEAKGLVSYEQTGRTKTFSPAVSREAVVAYETESLLNRAYQGSVGLLVNAMAQRQALSPSDIEELYAILQRAEEEQK